MKNYKIKHKDPNLTTDETDNCIETSEHLIAYIYNRSNHNKHLLCCSIPCPRNQEKAIAYFKPTGVKQGNREKIQPFAFLLNLHNVDGL